MRFKDLKPGDRFFFNVDYIIETGDDDYGIFFYAKLEKPVICQESLSQMRKAASKKNELNALLNLVCDGGRLNPYTAIDESGKLLWVMNEVNVCKLHDYKA